MKASRFPPFLQRRKFNRHRPCPRCSYINKDPRERFCKMCRADFSRKGLGRAKWPLILCALSLVAYGLYRTNSLDASLDALDRATKSLTRRVDTATQLPQHAPVPTVIGPARSGPEETTPGAPAPTHAPSSNRPSARPETASYQQPEPARSLAAAAAVVTGKSETSIDELTYAINTLRAVPASAPEYADAQDLLKRLEKRLQAARRLEEGRKQQAAPGKGRPARRRTPARPAA